MQPDGLRSATASVVVPAYNSARTIVRCLESLMSQETDLCYEVTVVESSGDGAPDLVRERFPQVRLIESSRRLFSGAARNKGAETASGEILLFLDSDCAADPSWIQKMWRTHCEFDVAAVAGAVTNGNPESPVSTAGYVMEFSDFFPFGNARQMDYLTSCNLSYKTEVFRRYGGFDPDQPLYVDLMFNKSLSAAGEKLLFDPHIRVAHLHRSALHEFLDHQKARGHAAAVARRKGLLAWKWCVSHPALTLLSIPPLFLRKAVVFPYRFARAYPSSLGSLARALPYMWMGLAYWHCGFIREVLAGRKDASVEKEAAGCETN